MPLDLAIPSLPTIALFVEDAITVDYLQALWQSPIDVNIRPVGGGEGVRAIVKAAEEAEYPNVFGLVDRDFYPTNYPDWHDPRRTFRTFVLPAHEIENYLLDADAIHSSRYRNRLLGPIDLAGRMDQTAGKLCWWAACRGTIAELKQRFREPFIGKVPQNVDEESARRHICESPWFAKLAGEAARSTISDVYQLLNDSHAAAVEQHRCGDWRREFAGKEIFRDVAGWMCDRPRVERFPKRDADFYGDVAKAVAAWQVRNDRVPAELAGLLAVIRARIARR